MALRSSAMPPVRSSVRTALLAPNEFMKRIAALHGTGLPLREPDAQCEACGARGTVGRAVRFEENDEIREIHRFCRGCWPEQSARYKARWEEETRIATEAWMRAPHEVPAPPSLGAAFEAATWHLTLDVIRELLLDLRRHERGDSAPTPEDLARFAADLVEFANEVEEPMPLMIEAFIHRYGARPHQ